MIYSPPAVPLFNVPSFNIPPNRPVMPPQPLPVNAPEFTNPGKPVEFRLTPLAPALPNQPVAMRLDLFEAGTGRPIRDMNVIHEKLMHAFMFSADLSDFQHLHPERLGPGTFAVSPRFVRSGAHQLFIQFSTPAHGEQTLSKPVQVGAVTPPPIPLAVDAAYPKWADGYEFRVSNLPTRSKPERMFEIGIFRNGSPVSGIEPFLGAGGHTVILSRDGQTFLHTHPKSKPGPDGRYASPLVFHTEIQNPGIYKLWTQVMLNGKLETVDWTFQV